MGVISFMSSVAFVVLTYWDLTIYDSCCLGYSDQQELKTSLSLVNKTAEVELIKDLDCLPKCSEFYNVRLPKPFVYADKVICGLYLIEYIINLFISQNRRQFIFSWSSISDLLVFIPPLIFDYDCSNFALFLVSVSRLLRINKAVKSMVVGDTDVSKKIISIIYMLIVLIYVSSGTFMVIENIGTGYYPVKLLFH